MVKKLLTERYSVLLEEEYGYRYWIWFPNLSEEDLQKWWRQLGAGTPFVAEPNELPGKVVELDDFAIEEFSLLENSGEFPYCHLHIDEDSYLKINGRFIYHAGYTGKFAPSAD